MSSVLTRVRHLNLSQIAASKFGPRPASPISPRTDLTLQCSESTLRKRSKQPYQPPGPPREAAHKRTHSWPDDEEEHRQQHSDGHAADVDAVLPVAPPARESNVTRRPRARRDVVPVPASVRWRGVHDGTNAQDNLTTQRLSSTPSRHRSRPPVGASGSNSIFGAV